MRKNISKAHKGKKSSMGMLGHKTSNETKLKLSKALKGLNTWTKGIKKSEDSRKKNSEGHRGNKSYLWKGGITPINRSIRNGIEFRLWREAVFARDNWTCQKHNIKGGNLHPHHIQNFAQYPELRFAIDNGITLCRDCHMKFHKKNGRKNNTKEQLGEFLKY